MKRAVLFVSLVCLLFAQVVMSQEKQSDADATKAPELTELEKLKISNLLKDFTIALQRAQLIQAQLQAANQQQVAVRAAYLAEVERIREAHEAPEAKFNFNPNTLAFELKPVPTGKPNQEEKEEASTD